MHENAISDVTRRNLFDELRLTNVEWAGRLDEAQFLTRIFDLSGLRSNDSRYRTMAADVNQHRVAWGPVDWGDDWVYDDARLNLLRCPDDVFLRFLCEMVHPIVRADAEEVERLVQTFNRHLATDGYELAPATYISGHPIFVGRQRLQSLPLQTGHARQVADDLSSTQVASQITRMETSIISDPALAIGSAKEFVETICKGILGDLGERLTGNENLPKLVKLACEGMDLSPNSTTADTLSRTLHTLATLTHGIAELRGQLGSGHGRHPAAETPQPKVARFAVNAAIALGVFLYETHKGQGSRDTKAF